MTPFEFIFHLNPPNRVLKSLQPPGTDLSEFTYEIRKFTFLQRNVELPQSIHLMLEKRLQTTPAIYSFIRTDARKIIIQPCQREFFLDNVFNSIQLPIESFLIFRKLDDAQGNFNSSILSFDHFNICKASLTCNDQVFPFKNLEFDWEGVKNGDVAFSCFDAYATLFSQDDVFSNQSNFIDLQRFTEKSFFILKLDLSNQAINSASACKSKIQASRLGNCRLSLAWSVNDNPALELLCVMKYYSNVTISGSRDVVKDYNL